MASPFISIQSIIQVIIDFFKNIFGIKSVTTQTTTQISKAPSRIIAYKLIERQHENIPIITRTTVISQKLPLNIPTLTRINNPLPKVKGKPIASPYMKELSTPIPSKTPQQLAELKSMNTGALDYYNQPIASLQKSGVAQTIQNLSQIRLFPLVPLSKKLSKNKIVTLK